MDDVPDDLDGCQRCPRVSLEANDEPPSLLVRARNGTPEDFGLPSIPSVLPKTLGREAFVGFSVGVFRQVTGYYFHV